MCLIKIRANKFDSLSQHLFYIFFNTKMSDIFIYLFLKSFSVWNYCWKRKHRVLWPNKFPVKSKVLGKKKTSPVLHAESDFKSNASEVLRQTFVLFCLIQSHFWCYANSTHCIISCNLRHWKRHFLIFWMRLKDHVILRLKSHLKERWSRRIVHLA